MGIPGFTAEDSFSETSGHYYTSAGRAQVQGAILPEFRLSPFAAPTPSCFPCYLDSTGACVQDCTVCVPGQVDGCQDFTRACQTEMGAARRGRSRARRRACVVPPEGVVLVAVAPIPYRIVAAAERAVRPRQIAAATVAVRPVKIAASAPAASTLAVRPVKFAAAATAPASVATPSSAPPQAPRANAVSPLRSSAATPAATPSSARPRAPRANAVPRH